ncbi:peptidoglycan editing factor PgeF [Oceanobacillus alkalisoli]|uniref:peptidoglycan editing factor PgeF n=1 Tax=Oceanobacillus alkalisoli TaxID=2925113 RepID=UPI001EF0C3D4|nr:peptidoglycan editing factor PgeF [Oceanobacillus alkalisoli]MCF3942509.1 peptidoglycan editing factor PgeF [Oceanobacillus alkalisoli]MCG5103566.1 peptidoglycan editing factor PgeF [Oceanobacillus alkalisoli]
MEPFIIKEKQLMRLINWKELSQDLVAGISTKNGGVSQGDFSSFNCGLHVHDSIENVLDNRRTLSDLTGFPLENWVAGEQVHGKKVQLVTASDKGKGAISTATALKNVDGILTKEKGIMLTAFFADCIPLFFYDPEEKIIGIAHAGWKGTVKEIAKEMVAQFAANGSVRENILVTIGPGISWNHYEVDEYVASQITKDVRDKVLTVKSDNHYLLDLKELNREILLHCGILRHNIDMTNYCTYREHDLFFSHRRDQGRTGRMLGFIGMLE